MRTITLTLPPSVWRIFVALNVSTACSFAQSDKPGSEDKVSNPVNDGVAIQLRAVKSPRYITESLKIQGRATCLWLSGCDIQKITWVLPEAIEATRVPAGTPEEGVIKFDASRSLKQGESIEFEFMLPAASYFQKNAPIAGLLSFGGGRYPLTVSIAYAASAEERTRSIERSSEVEFLPATGSLVIGGLIGSALLVFFERLVRLFRVLKSTPWPEKESGGFDWVKIRHQSCRWLSVEIPSGLTQFLLGGTTAGVVLLLVGAGQGADLPVMLQMKGLGGAMILGLFTHKLAEWGYAKLQGGTNAPSTTDAATSAEQPPLNPQQAEILRQLADAVAAHPNLRAGASAPLPSGGMTSTPSPPKT